MDLHSPKSPVQDPSDKFIDTIRHSPKSSTHEESSPSFSANYAEDALISYNNIITDRETLDFLKKHFPMTQRGALGIEPFLDTVLQEFFFRNAIRSSIIEDTIEFRRALRALLKKNLIAENPEVVSLNELNAHTKNKGLYNFVSELAKEVQNAEKFKVITQINDIVGDQHEAIKALNAKREELISYENRLREYEHNLNERENEMKHILQVEYERLLKNFEENYKDRVNNMQKRLTTHEKSMKLKIKQYETQIKDMKAHSSSSVGSSDEKFRVKVSSLEKSNEFLKLRVQELEKRITEEQEEKRTVAKKNKSKVDKSAKEEESAGSSINQLEEPVFVGKKDERRSSETGGVIVREEKGQRAQSMTIEDEEKEDEDTEKLKGKKTKGGTIVETSMSTKKKTTTAAKAVVSSGSEFKVLLNVVHSLVVCLKSTIPTFVQTGLGKEIKGLDEKENIGVNTGMQKKYHAQEEEKIPLDLGEMFYPCFDSLITNLTELMPIIGKPYDMKYIASIMEIYYKLLNFFFKFKIQHKFGNSDENRFLSEFDIQNSMDKVKTSQDHINEIMIPAQTAKAGLDVIFIPQTEYWKKIVKITKTFGKSKSIVDHPNPLLRPSFVTKAAANKPNNYIRLFAEELVQKELLILIKKFLDSTEFMLKGNEKDSTSNNPEVISIVTFHANLNLETQKYLQMTRLYAALIVILLAKTKKDQISGLQSIIWDLNVENAKIAEFLKLFLVENEGVNILFWLVQNFFDDFDIVQQSMDVLSSLNSNGAHYKQFCETVRKEENLKVIFDALTKYGDNAEFSGKSSAIVQKATEKNTSKVKNVIPDKYVKLLKDKLSEFERLQSNQPIVTNIRSILSNLNEI